MRCRYCQRRIPILRKLSDAEFCSDEHRLLFLAEQERLALARLVEAQQRFAQEALQVTRTARPHQEVFAPMASFVWNGPWEHAGDARVAGQAAPLPYKENVHLPRLEDSGVAAIARRPSRLHRPRAAAASGALAPVATRHLKPAPPELPSTAACVLPSLRLRLGAAPLRGRAECYHLRIASPEGCWPVLAAPFIQPVASGGCILPQSGLCPATPAVEVAKLAQAPVAHLGRDASVVMTAVSPQDWTTAVRLPVEEGILAPVAPGSFRDSASEADLSKIAIAGWTVLAASAVAPGIPASRTEVLPVALAPQVLMLRGQSRIQVPGVLPLPDSLSELSGPEPGVQDVVAKDCSSEPLAGCGGKTWQMPSLDLQPRCALNVGDIEALGVNAAALPALVESNPVSLLRDNAAELPLASGATPAPALLPAALGLVGTLEVPAADSPSQARAVAPEMASFEPVSPCAPECSLVAAGANLEARSRMAWLGFALPPVDSDSDRRTISARLEWPNRKADLPRLALEPCPPAAVTGEDLTAPLPERLAAVSALSRFWTAAPVEMRWAVAMLPLVFGLIWYAAGERPRRGEDGRVETVAASRPMAQFVKARWESVRQGIAERAGVELFDDFRSGLSLWQGGKDWAESWSYDNAGFARTGALALFTPSVEMADYEFEFLGRIEKKALSWVVRAPDTRNYHALKIVVTRPGPLPSIALVRSVVIEGKEGPQTRIPLVLTVTNDTLYRVKTSVRGNSFTVAIQGQVVATWSDERLPRGGIGFFSSKGEQSLLRWVTVTHQYDTIGKLCAYLAPFSIPSRKGD